MSDAIEPLRIALHIGDSTIRASMSEDGRAAIHPIPDEPTAFVPDLSIVRSSTTHIGDLTGAIGASALAAATTIRLRSGKTTTCWGLPASSPIGLRLAQSFTLRLHTTNSPFRYQPFSLDLVTCRDRLLTGAANGPADLEVHADWTAVMSWLAQPETLFADAFPSTVELSGEIALLSLFEGALWRATAGADLEHVGALLRWSQLWPTGAVRRCLRIGAAGPSTGTTGAGDRPARS